MDEVSARQNAADQFDWQLGICKYWVNCGTCQSGNDCKYGPRPNMAVTGAENGTNCAVVQCDLTSVAQHCRLERP
jgi:hypothetical protein